MSDPQPSKQEPRTPSRMPLPPTFELQAVALPPGTPGFPELTRTGRRQVP